MRSLGILSLVLIASAFAGAGCSKKSAGPTVIEARPQPYVADVPVPKGFNLDRTKSDHSYQEGKRKIRHYYLGNEDPQVVRNFYYQNMPTGEWKLIDETLHAGVYTLKYRKFEEAAEVRIEKIPAGMFKPGTQVVVSVKTPHLEKAND